MTVGGVAEPGAQGAAGDRAETSTSMIWPYWSTARYTYRHTPLTLMAGSAARRGACCAGPYLLRGPRCKGEELLVCPMVNRGGGERVCPVLYLALIAPGRHGESVVSRTAWTSNRHYG
jgi:hypothetical protein